MNTLSKIFATLTLIACAPFASAGCDLIEDPPVSESNCNDYVFSQPQNAPWTLLQANPTNFGLLSIGSISATASVTAADGATLVAQILPKQAGLIGGKVNAKTAPSNDKVELVLLQSASSKSLQLNVLRAGAVTQTYSANLPSASAANFSVSYAFVQGEMNVAVHAASGQLLNVNVPSFGQTLPSFMLRRGVDPTSQVTAAAFTQTGYSGQ
jgi:hypothetical protein